MDETYTTDEMKTEYAVHFKSKGKGEVTMGHYRRIGDAIASAEQHKAKGHSAVYIVTRYVTAWRMIVPHRKEN